MVNKSSHFPVMLNEVIENWLVDCNGFYVDATFGSGGHSKVLLTKLNDKGMLFSLDCDLLSEKHAKNISDSRFKFENLNFVNFLSFWKYKNLPQVDGIFFDLGYSTIQLNDENLGLSYKNLTSLNMSVDSNNKKTATFILNKYSKKDLFFIFRNYGEIPNPKNIVNAICEYRKDKKIESAEEFVDLVKQTFPVNKYKFNKDPMKLVFQALRIEVNDEINNLKNSLEYLYKILKHKGRALYLTFNSLEEKVIQKWISNNCNTIQISDYGSNIENRFRLVDSIFPKKEEVYKNWNSRSARLWIIEKN